MGTLIMVAVTLIAGMAVFGWVNGQASSSESAYGASVANNVNFLRERFVEVSQSFSGPAGACTGGQCTSASFWLYNSGQVDFTLQSISVQSLNSSYPLNVIFYPVSSTGCSATNQDCGFVATAPYSCGSTQALPTLNGFYQGSSSSPSVPSTLPQSQLSSSPYQITMPTSTTCSGGSMYLYDGVLYSFTFTGLYGNTVSTAVLVNG